MHGPALEQLCDRSEKVRKALLDEKGYYLSLRQASRILGVSHHTLQLWEESNLISRKGIKRRFPRQDLIHFVTTIGATDAAAPSRITRFKTKSQQPEQVLRDSLFRWSKADKALTPREIATRIGCHPSTIRRAIITRANLSSGKLGHIKQGTTTRWLIKRESWRKQFPNSILP